LPPLEIEHGYKMSDASAESPVQDRHVAIGQPIFNNDARYLLLTYRPLSACPEQDRTPNNREQIGPALVCDANRVNAVWVLSDGRSPRIGGVKRKGSRSMRVDKIFGAVLAASVAVTPVAATAAQPVGSILSVTGDTFVSREGRLLRAAPAMAVRAGDRVITSNTGSAKVGLNDCSVNVSGGQMASVSGGSCGSVKTASFDRAASTADDSSALRGRAGAGGFVVAIVAAVAVIIGIVIVVKNNDDTPTSP
jgi:hypothetical protein